MTHLITRTFIVRLISISIWVIAILLFLYSPQIIRLGGRAKVINVLAWPTVLDAEYLGDFEKKTGIKVHVNYYENNEEMLVKLEATADTGYDLIVPSDYAVSLLREKGLIKKIDKTQLNFIDTIEPFFNSAYYDPNNEYTVPFGWSVFGIGIDVSYFKNKQVKASWALLFDKPTTPFLVSMPDDARENVSLAAYYLFGLVDTLNSVQIEAVKQLLRKQKEWVASYTDLRADYLLISHTVPTAMTLSSEISRALHDYDWINFVIPEEGSFAVVDVFALPKHSKQDSLVYELLNYLYSPDVLQKYIDKHGFLPTVTTVKPPTVFASLGSPYLLFKRCNFFKPIVSESVLRDIWISLKS